MTKNFIKEIELQIKLPVRRTRSDNYTEFTNQFLNIFLVSKGINHYFSGLYTLQQSGVVDRRNRTLVKAARSMLKFTKLPLYFWAGVVATTCFVQNRSIIYKRLNKTPYEGLTNRKPNVYLFHIFGCGCFVVIKKINSKNMHQSLMK